MRSVARRLASALIPGGLGFSIDGQFIELKIRTICLFALKWALKWGGLGGKPLGWNDIRADGWCEGGFTPENKRQVREVSKVCGL